MAACDADSQRMLLAEVRVWLQSPGGAEVDRIAALLDRMDRASINAIDPAAGDTVLHVAARAGDLAVVKLLLAAGANARLQNAKGRTAGMQLNLGDDVRTELDAAAAAQQVHKNAAQSAVWGGAVQRTQTQSAFGLQTL